MAAITADGRQELVALYITMFGDAPSTVKLAEMVMAREAGKTLAEVATTLSSDSAFALVASKDADSFATYLANALLAADTPASARAWAINWVVTQVQGTKTKAQVIAEAVQAIRATTNVNYATAKAELTADVTVALNNIDNPVISGSTFTLTTGADQAAVVGKSGGDNYVSVIGTDGTVANGTTFNAGDNLDGAGGVDTLNISISGTNTGNHTASSFILKNIEKVLVANYESSAFSSTLDMAGATGVTTVGFSGASDTGATLFTNVQNLVDVDMANSNAALTVTYLGSVVAGTADTQKIALANVGQGATNNSTVTINGVETFDVTANSKSTLAALTGNADATVKLGGAGALTITAALDSTVKTVDASASTGGVTVTINNAAQNVAVTGGTGNDVIAIGDDLTVNDTLAGGDGTDTLIVSQSADLVDSLKITGFEQLRATQAGGSYDLSKLSGITSVDYRAAAAGDSITTTNSTATSVRVSADAATITHGAKDATLLSATADSLTISLQTASLTPNDVDITSLVVDGIENLTIASNGAATSGADSQNAITITQTAGNSTRTLTTLTVTGASDTSLGTTVASSTLTKIDGSAMTGALTVTNGSASLSRTTITGGSGNDNITGRATTDSISTGAGNDTVSSGNGGDSVDGGAGNDNITGGTGNDTIIGGDGDDTLNPGSGNDNITGGAGNDALTFTLSNTLAVASMGLNGSDTLDGGDGTDTITFSGSLTQAATLDLASTTDTTFTGVKNVETMVLAPSTSALTVTIGDIALGSFNNVATFTTTGATAAVNLDASAVLNSAAAITFTGTTGAAATYTVGNNKDLVTFSTQADTLKVVTAQFLQSTDSIVGGEGTDTFSLENTATTDVSFTSAQLGALSSFETWSINSGTAAAATAVTITVTDALAVANANATTGNLVITRDTSDTGALTANASAVTSRNVSLTGGNGNDTLTGGSGNDTLVGGVGVDNLTGGAGNDTFSTGAEGLAFGETYAGGDGTADILTLTANNQSLTGVTLTGTEQVRLANATTLNARADSIGTIAIGHSATTNAGTVTLALDLSNATSINLSGVTAGQAGATGSAIAATYSNLGATATNLTLTGLNDTLTMNNVANIVSAGAGNDSITGNAAGDTLYGGSGNDTLAGAASADAIYGEAGDDRITMDTAADTLDGGTGTDWIVLGTSAQATVDLSSATDQVSTFNNAADAIAQTNFENLDAAAATATVTVTAISTGSVIIGSSIADSITGGAGNDVITMNNVATTDIYDTISASTGTDTLVVLGTVTTNATLAQNYVDLANTTDQFVVNNAEAKIQLGFENVDLSGATIATGGGLVFTAISTGSSIAGTTLADSITGGAADDTIYGVRGADTITGGGGNDTLILINGGTAQASGQPNFTNTNVDTNAATLTTDANLATVETISIRGATGMTLTLTGQTEAFTITASTATAAETIVAGDGADTITGSSLADNITGGLGLDSMTGGSGADVFIFANTATGLPSTTAFDTITDYAKATDKIQAGTLLLGAQNVAAAAGVATITSGVATFNAADTTFAQHLTAVAASQNVAGNTVIWQEGSDSYVFISDATAGLHATDVLIKLTGVTAGALTVAGNQITAIA